MAREETREQSETSARSLGLREREIMSILCGFGSANVQQVAERISAKLAYTTVMTTLDRLFKKGFCNRKKEGRAYRYSAALTVREMEGQRAAGIIRRYFADSEQHPDILVSCLVDAVDHYDTRLLDQLEAKVRAARARQSATRDGA